MARPQMDSRVDGQSPTALPTCRMEVLSRDGRPAHRRWTAATQSNAMSSPPVPRQDAPREPQAEGSLLRENTGTEQERSCPAGTPQPQPDLLPENHGSSADAERRDARNEEGPMAEDEAVERVAIQLRAIGDEMNAIYLQRRNEVQHWQNWRGLYRGLVAFLADTISTLYQHRLR